MARIRTIKPEFWEDEKIGSLSPLARLLFVGAWNLADDEGLLRWTDDYLNAALFMYDGLTTKRVAQVMAELVDAGLVLPYQGSAQQRLGWIVHFRRHQRINRPQPAKFAAPSIQNPAIRDVYARRDGWTCHLCNAVIPVNTVATTTEMLSLDHLVPRSKGGSDYPSNIRAAHRGCNSGRGVDPVEGYAGAPRVAAIAEERANRTRTNSVSRSVNQSVNDSPPERKGREEERKGREVPTSSGDVVAAGNGGRIGPFLGTPNGGQILGHWIETCKKRPPSAVIVRVGKSVKQMLDEGVDPADIERGLADWHSKGADPSAVPSFVNQAMNSTGFRRSTTHDRVAQATAMVHKFEALDAAEGNLA